MIEAADAKLESLPLYSPDLNPIKLILSKAKQLLRSLAWRKRTAVWNAVQLALEQVTAIDSTKC